MIYYALEVIFMMESIKRKFKDLKKKETISFIIFIFSNLFLSCSLYAVSMTCFVNSEGSSLITSGVGGIAIILSRYVLPSLGVTLDQNILFSIFYVLMNVPLFFIAYKHIGKIFAVFTLSNVLLSSLIISLIDPNMWNFLNVSSMDMLTISLFSGLFTGLAIGFALKGNFSTGGTDIISLTLSIKKGISFGKYQMIINGIKYKVGRGSVVLTHPGDNRINYSFYTCDTIHFTTDEPSIIEFIKRIPTVINIYDYDFHYDFFKEVYKHYSTIDEDDLSFFMASDILQYLCFLKKESNDLNSSYGYINPSLRRCVDYIKSNYSNKLCLDEIAEAANISVSYMHKLFKKTFNKTPLEYITEIRIQKAKYLLVSTRLKISNISEKVGFDSITNFYITFKANTGISPGTFRKNTPKKVL